MKDTTNSDSFPTPRQSDDEIRNRARKLHARPWVIEISDDAEVIRSGDDLGCARIAAVIHLGPDD